jgi:iron complex outermembrane receptor protein
MICGAALLGLSATQASAQTTSGAPAAGDVSEVVVTGSRIPSPNLTGVSPVTAVTSEEIKLQGTTNVESMLNTLPQAIAAQSGGVSNGSTGTATVNLRGLGASRTLVLIDGRRLMPGDPAQPVADLNNIPAALVQRVDVLTGGASAVYGSDAIGGVVNFIMNRDFEGFRVDGQYSFYQHTNNNGLERDLETNSPYPVTLAPKHVTDGGTTDVTFVFGANAPDGKGNITAYGSYRHTQPVLQSQRDVSACSLAANTSAGDGLIYDARICAGSSNVPSGRFRNANVTAAGGLGGGATLNPNGTATFVNYGSSNAYNFGPVNYFLRPDDRYTAGFFAHYDVSKAVNLYSDFMFADDHTVAQIAPSGLFAGTGAPGTSTYGINCNNPLLGTTPGANGLSQAQVLCGAAAGTATVVQTTIGYRFAGLPRQDDLRHTNYRFVLGTRGELADGWNYDAYIQYGTTIYNEHYLNDVSTSRVQNALLVNPTTGQCQNGGTDGCVPLNLFTLNGISQAALNYVVAPGFKSGQTTEQIADVSVTGDLGQYGMKSPWANDGVGVALGAEYRRESLSLRTDSEFSSGDLSGQGGPSLGNSGSFDVYELFGEVRVPLLQDAPFAKSLDFEGGYRFSDYNTAANTTQTYKAGLNWSPIDDVKFRGSYNRSVRAPNVVELFAPSAVGLFGGNDPCAANASFAACSRSGVTAAQYAAGVDQCPAAQCSALFGGNVNLKAEKSDTYTVGVVLQPHWFRGFSMTVDYFDIKVNNLISALPNGYLIGCIANANADACSHFHRDPATGTIYGATGYIDARNVNTGYLKTSGVDVNANYRTNFSDWGMGDWGGVGFSFVGTYTDKYITEPATGAGTYDCAGLYGPVCSTNAATGPIPKWKHKFRATWTTPWPVTVSLDWRYISHVKFDANQSNIFLADPLGRTDVVDAKIKSYNYFDLSGTWRVRDAVTFRAGVNNLFDKDPPFLDSTDFPAAGPPYGNGNTYPGTYDALGRTIFVGLTADF